MVARTLPPTDPGLAPRRTRARAAVLVGAIVLAPLGARAGEPNASPGSSIIVAGQPFDVGHPVVLWSDPQGFDAYQTTCIDQTGGCCDLENKRYGVRNHVTKRSLPELQDVVQ